MYLWSGVLYLIQVAMVVRDGFRGGRQRRAGADG